MTAITKETVFEALEKFKHFDEDGNEYWFARELYPILGYSEYKSVLLLIKAACYQCAKNGVDTSKHFVYFPPKSDSEDSGIDHCFDEWKLTRVSEKSPISAKRMGDDSELRTQT